MSDRFDDERRSLPTEGVTDPGRGGGTSGAGRARSPGRSARRRTRHRGRRGRRAHRRRGGHGGVDATPATEVEPDLDVVSPAAGPTREQPSEPLPARPVASPATVRRGRPRLHRSRSHSSPSLAAAIRVARNRNWTSPRRPRRPPRSDRPTRRRGRFPSSRTGPNRRPARCRRSSPTATPSDPDLDAWSAAAATPRFRAEGSDWADADYRPRTP